MPVKAVVLGKEQGATGRSSLSLMSLLGLVPEKRRDCWLSSDVEPPASQALTVLDICGAATDKRWSHFLRQPAKVDSTMQRTIHHEDAETVFGGVQGQGRT
jgi:hypothetical protein